MCTRSNILGSNIQHRSAQVRAPVLVVVSSTQEDARRHLMNPYTTKGKRLDPGHLPPDLLLLGRGSGTPTCHSANTVGNH